MKAKAERADNGQEIEGNLNLISGRYYIFNESQFDSADSYIVRPETIRYQIGREWYSVEEIESMQKENARLREENERLEKDVERYRNNNQELRREAAKRHRE